MINDPFHPEQTAKGQSDSIKLTLLAVVCAIALTATLLIGYAYFRSRHAQEVLLSSAQVVTPSDNSPKGPPIVNVVIDEPLLQKGTTVLRGSLKNISKQTLSGLTVTLELRRRRDGGLEEKVIDVSPDELRPDQEGTYTLKLAAQDYASIRLSSLTADPQSTLIAYSTSPGKKRPPERIEPPRAVAGRPSTRTGEFLNTPDNPVRVP